MCAAFVAGQAEAIVACATVFMACAGEAELGGAGDGLWQAGAVFAELTWTTVTRGFAGEGRAAVGEGQAELLKALMGAKLCAVCALWAAGFGVAGLEATVAVVELVTEAALAVGVSAARGTVGGEGRDR